MSIAEVICQAASFGDTVYGYFLSLIALDNYRDICFILQEGKKSYTQFIPYKLNAVLVFFLNLPDMYMYQVD